MTGKRFGVDQDKATFGQKVASSIGSIMTMGLSESAATSIAQTIHKVGSGIGKVVSGIGDCIMGAVLGFIGFVCGDPELSKKWETAKGSISEAWTGMIQGINDSINGFVKWWNEPPSLLDSIKKTFGDLIELPKKLWNGLSDGVANLWKNFNSKIESAWSSVSNWFGNKFDMIKDMLPDWLKRLIFEDGFPGKLNSSAPKSVRAQANAQSVQQGGTSTPTAPANNPATYNPSKGTVDSSGRTVGGFGQGLSGMFGGVSGAVSGVVSGAAQSVGNFLSNTGTAIADTGIKAVNAVSGFFGGKQYLTSTQLNEVRSWAKDDWQGKNPNTTAQSIFI